MRRGRKFKERRSIFSFGHIMLPLVGLLALGLLILGVRLLFFQSPEEFSMGNYQAEESVTEREPLQEGTKPPVQETAEDETQSKQVVAVPVEIADEEKEDTKTGVTSAKEEEKQATAVTVEKQPSQETVKTGQQKTEKTQEPTSASSLPSSGFWGVQVGAFTVRESAENLASEVRQKGHEAFVIPAEVGGKQYYRVRVKAGDNRKAAEQLEKTLASEGYPTLVAYQE
ncbi:MAG: SPOR domain-containing protein [Thermovirgaceae bacterium]